MPVLPRKGACKHLKLAKLDNSLELCVTHRVFDSKKKLVRAEVRHREELLLPLLAPVSNFSQSFEFWQETWRKKKLLLVLDQTNFGKFLGKKTNFEFQSLKLSKKGFVSFAVKRLRWIQDSKRRIPWLDCMLDNCSKGRGCEGQDVLMFEPWRFIWIARVLICQVVLGMTGNLAGENTSRRSLTLSKSFFSFQLESLKLKLLSVAQKFRG